MEPGVVYLGQDMTVNRVSDRYDGSLKHKVDFSNRGFVEIPLTLAIAMFPRDFMNQSAPELGKLALLDTDRGEGFWTADEVAYWLSGGDSEWKRGGFGDDLHDAGKMVVRGKEGPVEKLISSLHLFRRAGISELARKAANDSHTVNQLADKFDEIRIGSWDEIMAFLEERGLITDNYLEN